MKHPPVPIANCKQTHKGKETIYHQEFKTKPIAVEYFLRILRQEIADDGRKNCYKRDPLVFHIQFSE